MATSPGMYLSRWMVCTTFAAPTWTIDTVWSSRFAVATISPTSGTGLGAAAGAAAAAGGGTAGEAAGCALGPVTPPAPAAGDGEALAAVLGGGEGAAGVFPFEHAAAT